MNENMTIINQKLRYIELYSIQVTNLRERRDWLETIYKYGHMNTVYLVVDLHEVIAQLTKKIEIYEQRILNLY
jgi:hypothetical protein